MTLSALIAASKSLAPDARSIVTGAGRADVPVTTATHDSRLAAAAVDALSRSHVVDSAAAIERESAHRAEVAPDVRDVQRWVLQDVFSGGVSMTAVDFFDSNRPLLFSERSYLAKLPPLPICSAHRKRKPVCRSQYENRASNFRRAS